MTSPIAERKQKANPQVECLLSSGKRSISNLDCDPKNEKEDDNISRMLIVSGFLFFPTQNHLLCGLEDASKQLHGQCSELRTSSNKTQFNFCNSKNSFHFSSVQILVLSQWEESWRPLQKVRSHRPILSPLLNQCQSCSKDTDLGS